MNPTIKRQKQAALMALLSAGPTHSQIDDLVRLEKAYGERLETLQSVGQTARDRLAP